MKLPKKQRKKIDVKKITSKQVEEELRREIYKSRYTSLLRSTIYSLIIIAAVATLIATLVMPVLEIKGDSMSPEYENGDIALAIKTKKINQNEIISFYHGNKILVKRVIAKSGDWVKIDETGKVYVNEVEVTELTSPNDEINLGDIKYPYQVPDNSYFVLSDNSEDIQDSRLSQIGCIDQDDIIGKIIFRLWPLNK